MASCAQIPTQTLFETVTSTLGSISTSTSLNVVTGAPTTSTVVQSGCLTSVNGTCASTTFSTTVTIIPGEATTSTVLIPVTADVPVTETIATQTLFAVSCQAVSTVTPTSTPPHQTTPTSTPPASSTTPRSTTTPQPVGPTSITTTSSSTPTQTPPSSTQQYSTSFGSQTVFTSVVTVTAPDGSLTTTAIQVTGTPVLSIPINSGGGNSKTHMGPIVGGVIGGLAALALLATIAWLWWRKRHTRWEDIWEDDDQSRYRDDDPPRRKVMLEAEVDPKPYEYGMVGTGTSSAPQSPALPPTGVHGRSPSITPLLLGGSGAPSTHTSVDMSPSLAGTPVSHYHQSLSNLNAPYDGHSRRSSGPPTLSSSREGSNSSSLYGSAAPLVSGRQAKTRSLGGAPTLSGSGGWTTTEDGKLLPQAYGNVPPTAGNGLTSTSDDAAMSSFSVVRKPRPQSIPAQITPSLSTGTASPSASGSSLAFGRSSSAGSTPAPTPYQPHPKPTVSTTMQYPPTRKDAAEQSPNSPTTGTRTIQPPSFYSRDSVDDMGSASLLPGLRLGVVNPDVTRDGDTPSATPARWKP